MDKTKQYKKYKLLKKGGHGSLLLLNKRR